MRRAFLDILLPALLLTLAAHAGLAQISYSVSEDLSLFGWLDQYSLDTPEYDHVGPMACVPTSATNALTYLQNARPDLFGAALTGATYADWIATDATLISPAYMDTTPSGGTYFRTIPSALTTYFTADPARNFSAVQFSGMFLPGYWTSQYPQPSYIASGVPTWSFLYGALAAQSAVMLSVIYANGDGHELLLSGFQWLDANSDGIIQFDENATLSFVDPLDPSATYPGGDPGGGAKFTTGHVWFDSAIDGLKLNYSQYQGGLPYNSADYQSYTLSIDDAFTIAAVPEPASLALTALGLLTFAIAKRRKRKSES
jgi:hypothetical protein